MVKSCTIIYIPIWLYSNVTGVFNTIGSGIFTFQSGYIQIWCQQFISYCAYNLHSNLVIFKSGSCGQEVSHLLIYIPIWLYSNTGQTAL